MQTDLLAFALKFDATSTSPNYVPPATPKKRRMVVELPGSGLEIILDAPPRVGQKIMVDDRTGIVKTVVPDNACGAVAIQYGRSLIKVVNYRVREFIS